MKAKLKNANGFVRFLLQHGEKIGIAAVLVVAGLLIYKSLGRETLGEDKQAPQLQSAAQQAQQQVTEKTWDSLPEEDKTDVSKFIARSGEVVITPVRASDFPRIDAMNPPVIEPMKLRQDPVLLTATDLEVQSDSGLWMSADPAVIREKMLAAARAAQREEQEAREEQERAAEEEEDARGRGPRGRDAFGGGGRMGEGAMGDMAGMKTRDGALVVPPRGGSEMQGFEDIRERSWVTVLAKVPIKDQFQMYEDALVGAANFNATNDQPQYLGYVVERAEVTAKGQGPWTRLNPVTGAGVVKVMTTWPIQTPELVTPKYVHPLLTFPLPPMVMREWGDNITHSDMPIQTPEEIAEEEMRAMEEAQQQPEDAAEDSENPFASVLERRTQANQFMGGREMAMGGRNMGRPAEMGGAGMYRGGGGERMGGRMGGMGGDMGGPTELEEKQWDGKTEYYLFRYFDSTVEPGHRYRYRVQLVFVDVNAGQTPRYLAPEVAARIEKKSPGYRATEWSEPSPVAVVPQSGLAYLASVKPASANNVNSEPEARLIVKALNAENAAEVALHDWFRRGAVMNRLQRAQIIWSSIYKANPDVESPEFEFITGQTLVDFDGGEPLTPKNRNLTAPARALVMDSAGRLRLRNELADEEAVRPFDYILQEAETAARRDRERGDARGREGGRGR